MSVTAKSLSKSGARGKDIDTIVQGQLKLIDDKLLQAPRMWGRNTILHELPVSFGLVDRLGLSLKNEQRIIYSSIVRSLERRGFEVALVLETSATTLCIAWMTDLDVAEVAAMNAQIKARRIRREELPRFRAKGRIPAPRAAAIRGAEAENGEQFKMGTAGRVMQPRGGVESAGAEGGEGRAPPAGQAAAAEAAIIEGA